MQKEFLVVIDEFTYLVERDMGILSDFQEIVDEILPKSKIKIILSGSLVGMMEGRVLGYRSPIYGRTKHTIKLRPLYFGHLAEWFRSRRLAELFKIYAVTNGVPKYLEFFACKDVMEEIKHNFFDNASFLFRDALELLKEELRNPTNYIMILEAIANGMTRLSEISNYTYIEPVKLTAYLSTLRNLEIVRREVPLLAPKEVRRGIYTIADFYFGFWFRFISPYYEEIENEAPEAAIVNFERNFNTYLGTPFECYARSMTGKILKKHGYILSKIGRWWHGDVDIDIVAIDDHNKTVIFGEAKWKTITQKEAYRIIHKLEEKAEAFPHRKTYRKTYCIIAREFKDVDIDDIILIDINKLASIA